MPTNLETLSLLVVAKEWRMKVAFFHVNVVFNVPNSLARHASSVKHANNHYWGLRPFTYLPKVYFFHLKAFNKQYQKGAFTN